MWQRRDRTCPTQRLRLAPAVLSLLAALASTPAAAALIEGDLSGPGDALITLDTDSGLEWLDLTETRSLSYDDLVGGAGGYMTTEGFRYATTTEVAALWSAAGIVDTTGTATTSNRAGVDLLLALMGCTTACGSGFDAAQGMAEYDPAIATLNAPFIQIGAGGVAGATLFPGANLAHDFSSSTLGSYLVRSTLPQVPEPGTGALLAGGLALLAGLRRRSAARR